MIFANNATIIEFPLLPHVDRCYGFIASALSFDYWIVPQVSSLYFANYTVNEERSDVVVNLLQRIVSSKGVALHPSAIVRDDLVTTAASLSQVPPLIPCRF